ncbi:hypothetical protein BAU15_07145 [Enterococcus sp. JM4C]|nr:SdpI family protein [Enterococcus sp. JM4C]KAF1297484.1 hypothetical protein BAU15_07145 [Enterococcus sp. JM4C]
MIFLYVGSFLIILGLLMKFIPAKREARLFGYHSPLAEKSDAHFRYAQKVSSWNFLLFGGLMALIGWVLKTTGHTNFFLVEMLVLVFPIMPIFILTEKKLEKFDKEFVQESE